MKKCESGMREGNKRKNMDSGGSNVGGMKRLPQEPAHCEGGNKRM